MTLAECCLYRRLSTRHKEWINFFLLKEWMRRLRSMNEGRTTAGSQRREKRIEELGVGGGEKVRERKKRCSNGWGRIRHSNERSADGLSVRGPITSLFVLGPALGPRHALLVVGCVIKLPVRRTNHLVNLCYSKPGARAPTTPLSIPSPVLLSTTARQLAWQRIRLAVICTSSKTSTGVLSRQRWVDSIRHVNICQTVTQSFLLDIYEGWEGSRVLG
jgi:hypothetical protein